MNHGDAEAQRNRLNELSARVIGLGIEIHRELGPGLLESAYEECLAYELSKTGLRFERQKPLPVRYKDVRLDCGYRLDLVVEDALILEVKAVTEILPIHEAQLLTYLKIDRKSLGLLINFNVPVLKQGVKPWPAAIYFVLSKAGYSGAIELLIFLCASVPLWFR
jgi:GxxExxY protein